MFTSLNNLELKCLILWLNENKYHLRCCNCFWEKKHQSLLATPDAHKLHGKNQPEYNGILGTIHSWIHMWFVGLFMIFVSFFFWDMMIIIMIRHGMLSQSRIILQLDFLKVLAWGDLGFYCWSWICVFVMHHTICLFCQQQQKMALM